LILFCSSWLWHKFNIAQKCFVAAGSPDGQFSKFLRRARYDRVVKKSKARKRAFVSTRTDAHAQISPAGPPNCSSQPRNDEIRTQFVDKSVQPSPSVPFLFEKFVSNRVDVPDSQPSDSQSANSIAKQEHVHVQEQI
jgi:hypothetical protein